MNNSMKLKELYDVKFQEALVIIIQIYCLIKKKLTLINRGKELQMLHQSSRDAKLLKH